MTFLTPLEMFFRWEEEMPHESFLVEPLEGKYYNYTWQQVGDQARRMAAYIDSLNLPPFTKIGILSQNCAHWVIADLAIMMAKHISVPLFPNMSNKALGKTIRHSDMGLLFLGKLDDFENQRTAIPKDLPSVLFPCYRRSKTTHHWNNIIQNYSPLEGSIKVDAGTPATIMYTSGTSDRPKGAMHDYYNLTFVSDHYRQLLGMRPKDRLVSHLPLAHMVERVLIELGAIYAGASITFCNDSKALFTVMRRVKPTLFGGLPHTWRKINQEILGDSSGWSLRLALSLPIVNWLIRRRTLKRIGLEKCRLFITGGAPMDHELKRWFQKLAIRLEEIYAMTENTCYSHSTLLQSAPVNAVGRSLPEVDVKIATDGEVLMRHEGMMRGYYQETELTLEAFTADGFLKTGDRGTIDKEGNLIILGSMEDVKLPSAAGLTTNEIERNFCRHYLIDQVCIIEGNEEEKIALTVLMNEARKQSKVALTKELEKVLAKINSRLSPADQMAKMVIMQEPMTVENGLLTPTMKVKRQAVERRVQHRKRAWSQPAQNVIWIEEALPS